MLMRSEPFREFDRMTEEMLSERRARQIPVDAYRRGNEFKVHLDLPGVDARFIELTVEKDLLTVRATRGWVRAEGDQIQIAERAQGEFSRQLFLGEGLGPRPHQRQLRKRCAHADRPRLRGGQAPSGRDHPRRRYGPICDRRRRRRVSNPLRPDGTAPSSSGGVGGPGAGASARRPDRRGLLRPIRILAPRRASPATPSPRAHVRRHRLTNLLQTAMSPTTDPERLARRPAGVGPHRGAVAGLAV